MISLPRHLDIDLDLLQATLYPVKELERLRVTPPVLHLENSTLVEGTTPLKGVQGRALDIEVMFDWSHTNSGKDDYSLTFGKFNVKLIAHYELQSVYETHLGNGASQGKFQLM